MPVSRRQLLGALGAAWLADHGLAGRRPIAGRLVGHAHQRGHLLRQPRALEAPKGPPERAEVVIVGSGASGLGAAWRLRDCGLAATMLEVAPYVGGTSTWDDDGVLPHPWGGHYLPAPNPELRATLRLLSDLGVVTGFDSASRPEFDEEMLCHAPQERLYYRGAWWPTLVPLDALEPAERAELERFGELEEQLTDAVGDDGRPAFQLPLEQSSRDEQYLELDRISMAEWMTRQGFKSPFLRWYVRYATLDDFGAELDQVSAWAAWHYFTARKLRTEQLTGSRFLVWPEGNGWLLRRMLAELPGERRTGALVRHLQPRPTGGVELQYVDLERAETRRIEARAAILATPAFVAHRVLAPAVIEANRWHLRRRTAAPWMVANLHLRRPIEPNLPWDSVIHDGVGLGYVDASHQRTALSEHTIWTYYRAYGGPDTPGIRTELLQKTWTELASEVLVDLAPAHPELPEQLERLDVMLWGHGMPRPTPGFLGPQPFSTQAMLARHIAWAHVDQGGMALFEEATRRGVRAAEAIADSLQVERGASWL